MRFLIDEDLPRATGELLRGYGYQSSDVRDIGLRGAVDSKIASYARENALCLLTGDFGFADVRNYPPAKYGGIVVIKVPNTATADFILKVLEGYLKQGKIVSETSGNLLVVEPDRIRIRRH